MMIQENMPKNQIAISVDLNLINTLTQWFSFTIRRSLVYYLLNFENSSKLAKLVTANSKRHSAHVFYLKHLLLALSQGHAFFYTSHFSFFYARPASFVGFIFNRLIIIKFWTQSFLYFNSVFVEKFL